MENALKEGKNPDFLIKLFPNMGHGFQTCKPGPSLDTADPLQGLALEVLAFIGDWIGKHTK
jgi:hypothetical protein